MKNVRKWRPILGKLGVPLMKTKTKRVVKQVVPDVTAQIFWLKNRKPEQWRDKVEAVPVVGNGLLESLIRLEKGAGNG